MRASAARGAHRRGRQPGRRQMLLHDRLRGSGSVAQHRGPAPAKVPGCALASAPVAKCCCTVSASSSRVPRTAVMPEWRASQAHSPGGSCAATVRHAHQVGQEQRRGIDQHRAALGMRLAEHRRAGQQAGRGRPRPPRGPAKAVPAATTCAALRATSRTWLNTRTGTRPTSRRRQPAFPIRPPSTPPSPMPLARFRRREEGHARVLGQLKARPRPSARPGINPSLRRLAHHLEQRAAAPAPVAWPPAWQQVPPQCSGRRRRAGAATGADARRAARRHPSSSSSSQGASQPSGGSGEPAWRSP